MAHLKWTAEAERWLQDILDYIAEDNPEAAIDTIEAFTNGLKFCCPILRLEQDMT